MARRGRPTKPAKPGTKASLGLKVTAETKALLEEAARQSGRTQSQEAEYRLEQSFDRRALLPQVMEERYGDQIASLGILLGDVARYALSVLSIDDGLNPETGRRNLGGPRRRLNDPLAYAIVMRAILSALEGMQPRGAGAERTQKVTRIADISTEHVLSAYRSGKPNTLTSQWAAAALADLLKEKK